MTHNDEPQTITGALMKPFTSHAIKTRTGTGWKYVDAQTVIRRLISATDNTWDWDVHSIEYRPYGKTEIKPDGSGGNDRTLIIVRGRLTIFGLGTRSGVGVQVVTSEVGGEDLWKGADADALKNAAKNFGVALDLYGPDYEAGELDRVGDNPRGSGSAPASVAQRDFIKSLQSGLGLPNSEMVRMTSGKQLVDLTKHEASRLIEQLQAQQTTTY